MSENKILDDHAMDILFRKARTYSKWQDKDVSDVLIGAIYDLTKYGPTAANSSPARMVFVKSEEGKERLKPYLSEGNIEKTMTAPVTAIIGYDIEFYNKLPQLFPHVDAKAWYENDPEGARENAFRNSSLQGAYVILAARTLGLDCGPMSGFDAAGVKEEFFPGTSIEVNFLCNIGYGDSSDLYDRSPRLSFDEAVKIV